MEWFVVHTRPQNEMTALRHLSNQKFSTYLPCIKKLRRHARRQDWSIVPLFPRYLFVRVDIETSRWRAINSTFGVSHLICEGNRPLPIADSIVENIRHAEDEHGYIQPNQLQRPLKSGEEVEFVSGPLINRTGTLFDADSDSRVTVLLNMLGRDIKVAAELSEIARIA